MTDEPVEDRVDAGRPPMAPGRQRFDICNGDADGLCAALQWRSMTHRPQRC